MRCSRQGLKASTMTAQDNTGPNKIGATLIRKIHAEMHKKDWTVLLKKLDWIAQFAPESTKMPIFISYGPLKFDGRLLLHTPTSVYHEQIPSWWARCYGKWGTNGMAGSFVSLHPQSRTVNPVVSLWGSSFVPPNSEETTRHPPF
jgi:hypothetical protein